MIVLHSWRAEFGIEPFLISYCLVSLHVDQVGFLDFLVLLTYLLSPFWLPSKSRSSVVRELGTEGHIISELLFQGGCKTTSPVRWVDRFLRHLLEKGNSLGSWLHQSNLYMLTSGWSSTSMNIYWASVKIWAEYFAQKI